MLQEKGIFLHNLLSQLCGWSRSQFLPASLQPSAAWNDSSILYHPRGTTINTSKGSQKLPALLKLFLQNLSLTASYSSKRLLMKYSMQRGVNVRSFISPSCLSSECCRRGLEDSINSFSQCVLYPLAESSLIFHLTTLWWHLSCLRDRLGYLLYCMG